MADEQISHGVDLGDQSSTTHSCAIDSSNIEHLSQSGMSHSNASRCLWMGKIYFAFLLAEPIFRNADGITRSDGLEDELEAARSSFPYQAVTEKLAALLSSPPSDNKDIGASSFSRFATVVGMILRQSNPNTQRQMHSLIQSRGSTSTAFESQGPVFSPPITPPEMYSRDSTNAQIDIPASASFETKIDIAKYSMALKEHTDQTNVSATYEERNITLGPPPVFQATLRYGVWTFIGNGQSKKAAKHVCSKQACEALGIRV